MRLGKVTFKREYIVDLDDEVMIQHAKEAVYEDLTYAFKCDSIFHKIETTDEDKTLTKENIPEFLLQDDDE